MRTRAPWLLLAASLLAAGCVTETKLQPLPTAQTTQAGAAVIEEQGVRLVADGDAWRGTPSSLERIVTPVQVRIENQSGRPLRIRYEVFTLLGSSRFQYSALSPFELADESGTAYGGSGYGGSGGNVRMSVGMGFGWSSGWAGPPFATGYYGWRHRGGGIYNPWYDPWYDPFYRPYSYYWDPPEPLPTRDMLKQALPEGTLDTGGTITGFLYFQDVSEREGRVTLQARLVDARTGEQFGTLSIPFDVRS
ncbi:hypothetical protein JRI60_04030 [Archangium violaceum]|uniref:hypothetical protein n=1 Tax=Archangium violaceum TaxID=83451 RepID=UPI001950B0FF|nr:hypothetical protein [Archangium violaceum]QRN98248.1 hypothetical protein JRI60_04030 [Archangium violaceum]